MSVLKTIAGLFRGTTPKEDAPARSAEELRALFKARFLTFRMLLKANNKALEIMADMEAALRGSRVFGMSFIRANATAVSVNVYRLVQSLQDLAPGKYNTLAERFYAIQSAINDTLSKDRGSSASFAEERPILRFSEMDKSHSDQAGSKMANLGEMMNGLGLPVPPGFVVTAAAYGRFMAHNDLQAEINRRLQAGPEDGSDDSVASLYRLSSDIQQLIIRAEVPPDLAEAIRSAYAELGTPDVPEPRVSLRSSALGEDAAGASFAGQFRSILNVSGDHLLDAYKEVVASKYSLQAMTYRLSRGLRDEDIAMCVGCMLMLDARAGGVMYSRSPVNARDDSISISSVWGLPKSVVDGSAASDLFVVARQTPMRVTHRDIKAKADKFVCDAGEGVCRMVASGPERDAPSLTDDEVLQLAAMAVRLEEHYGPPQDIEWAILAPDRIFLLQCRPLHQLDGHSAPAQAVEAALPDGVLAAGGVTASPGAGSGSVFIARKEIDALRFPQGGVLVTAQSLPRWASLLSRAAAVITEQGGVTGHLANVAREFEVPALFEIPGATTRLAEGQVVTVDADGHRVYEGRIDALLVGRTKRRNIMQDSPVFETLRQVAGLVIPLNLLDPTSSAFDASNCRTYHDITRFVHEKSVEEMFSFGNDHNLAERSGKQLVYRVPMQWWVINLDDGFKEEVTGKRVDLANIASIPMLAIWDGMIAVQWSGPPAPSGRGMLSVFVESSMNTEIAESGTGFTTKSFFMISKTYCCLSTRVGFHFTTIEAMAGDDPVENYISFRYAGGAADADRKTRRAEFIAEILEPYGFATDVKQDLLSARVEGRDASFITSRLKILGYLLIHTRQIDMIMAEPATVARYREKFGRDITSFLGE